jgi:murein DD-endopeptidase MepM/ murein hydrolase activator NlpD
MPDKTESNFESTFVTNPCDNPPNWPLAPQPSKKPLASMQWATGLKKDKYGCTRDGNKKFHAGIDIKAVEGTACFATEDARVNSLLKNSSF